MPSKLTGEWDKLDRTMQKLKFVELLDDFEEEFKALGDSIADKVRGHIKAQDLPWEELSEDTIARKGFDTIYINTGFFFRHIEVKIERVGKTKLRMQILPEDVTHPGGRSLRDLARDLEFGTTRMPARPIWRPVLAKVSRGKAFKNLKRIGNKVFSG